MTTRAEEIAAKEYPKSKGDNRIHPDVFRAEGFTKGYTRGQQDRWISVKDRLPKEGDHVLATDGENVVEVMYCRYGADPRTTLAFRRTAIGPVLDDVTQWCELPSPPNPEQR